ncbi:MAG: peptide ABC transporter substrate-binding protein [Opitutaceae bacterium]|jgi:oligopeptide transport system substrate-binding protein
MRPSVRALAALLAASVALGGCSRRADVQTGDAAQVLHRGIGPDLPDLDPHLWTQTSDYTVLSSLLEGLVGEDPRSLAPVPGVAESWEVSPDGLRYTFHLRADARWSDGRPVTAGDFIASWRRMLTPSLGATNASQLYLIQGAEAFNKGDSDFSQVGLASGDARTLSVTLEHPAPWFLSFLSSPSWLPVPVATIAKFGGVAQRGNPWAVPGRFVGNGPFNLRSWHRGQEIVVTKSPTYWDAAHVRLQAIHFHEFDSIDAEERAFRAGQLHVTETIPPDRIDAYRRDSPKLLRIDPLLGTYFLRVNIRRPGLSQFRIRRALSLAIDRQAIVEKLLRGGEEPAASFTPPGLGGYAPDPGAVTQTDLARRLLAEAGFPGGAGLPAFNLLYNTSESHGMIAEAIQEMWRRELGIQVTLVNADMKVVEEARAAGAYDLLQSSWIADYADPSAFLDVWRSDSGNNFTGWSNADYDGDLFAAARTADPSARNALYSKAERILLDEAPVIPLYHYTHVFLIRPSVRGWSPTLLDHHPYKDVWLGDD